MGVIGLLPLWGIEAGEGVGSFNAVVEGVIVEPRDKAVTPDSTIDGKVAAIYEVGRLARLNGFVATFALCDCATFPDVATVFVANYIPSALDVNFTGVSGNREVGICPIFFSH